jgi:hypothetical protein
MKIRPEKIRRSDAFAKAQKNIPSISIYQEKVDVDDENIANTNTMLTINDKLHS